MLLSHIKRLCFLFPTVISAIPQFSDQDPPAGILSSLPASLEQAVPACAQPCLRESLFSKFPLACTSRSDLNCLCSRYSTTGQSLGEVALGCIYAACSSVDSRAASAYNVCFGQRDAVPATLTALTVTATTSGISTDPPTSRRPTLPSTSASSPTSTSTLASSSKGTSTSTTLRQTSTGSSDPAVVNSIAPSSSIASQETQATTNAAVAASESPRTMKPAQIAGLAIAAAATFCLAIGLMVLSTFLRRRREKAEVAEMALTDKKHRPSTPKTPFTKRFTKRFSAKPRSPVRTKMHYSGMGPNRQWPGVGLTPASRKNPHKEMFNPIKPPKSTYVAPVNSRFNLNNPPDYSMTHPAFRPNFGNPRDYSAPAVPLEQIGLAVTAELPDNRVPIIRAPKAPERPQPAQQHPKILVPGSESTSQRPYSVLTQDTVFEEDAPPERRQSTLLPTPPIPIPPIRSFQPSRQPTVVHPGPAKRTVLNGPQGVQQPGLSLNIPVRSAKTQPKQVLQSALARKPLPNPSIKIDSAPENDQKRSTSGSEGVELSNGGYIPDYYFTSYTPPPPPPRTPSPKRIERPKESPKMVHIRPKTSSSNVSRATSRGSTNVRDSISSQTSFETVDPDDPTPDDEDDDKRLSASKLSPVAESPISNLRYPKVPRASNQLVPRSPRSPQSQKSPQSLRGDRSPITSLGSSSLLAKRLGESEAHQMEGQLWIQNYRQHLRSTSSVDSWDRSQHSSARHTRSQSGMWPKSPMMYDESDVVKPLNIRPKPPEMGALKSPAWVPRLTPTRQGDDLLISVSYAKPGH